jgi:biotin carboxylase
MAPTVLFLSPGYPAEMPMFTRGLAQVGARAFGVGDQPSSALAPEARAALSDYLQVKNLWDEAAVVDSVRAWLRGRGVDRVECLWEPGVVLAARLREVLGCPGMRVENAVRFRDKELMKEALDRAGVRTPKHARARNVNEARAARERIGFPLILKPIAGAGSADTYTARDEAEFERALELTRHVPEISVEEYIEGEELTYDTICAQGDVLFHNVCWYRPKPLVARLNEWVSSQSVALRDTDTPDVQKGRALGREVLRTLGFESGYTHMEWFLTPKGEAVFGEIGARAPGARLVHAMNYVCDADFFAGWAEAVAFGRLSQPTARKYNAACVFKRAVGQGKILRHEGLERLLARYGEHIPVVDLNPIGAPRRDWKNSVVGDGWLVARHPNLEFTLEIADRIGTELRIVAG